MKMISELGVLGVPWREVYPNPTGLRSPINLRKSRKLTGIVIQRTRSVRISALRNFVRYAVTPDLTLWLRPAS